MKKDKILLVYPAPDCDKHYRFGYSLLLLYIASDLRSKGYEVKLIDFSVNRYDFMLLSTCMEGVSIVVVEIDAFPLKRSVNIKNAGITAMDIRKINKDALIVAVGKQCTLFNQDIEFADVTISGDSEMSISKIIDLHEHSIKSIERHYEIGNIKDLSELPMPAYDMLSVEQICGKTNNRNMRLAPSALLETSRGCPGQCTFCQRKGWLETVLRFPVETVRKNFYFLKQSGIKNIWITDENFAGNIAWSKEFLRMFVTENAGNYRPIKLCISSWVHIDKEFLLLAKSAGISIISFGIESIAESNQIFYKKKFNPQTVADMIEFADSLGIYTVGNFIIGSPYDTEQTVLEDISFAKNSKLDMINVKTLDYMMGSELYDNLPNDKRKGIHFFASKECGVSSLTSSEIKKLTSKFYATFLSNHQLKLLYKIDKYGPPYYGGNYE